MRMRHFWHTLPMLGALALVWLLVLTSDLTLDQLSRTFDAVTVFHAGSFFAITLGLLGLSAAKWRLVMIHLPASEGGVAPSRTGSFLYTCLGAVLSLVLMPHVAKLTGRALGARLHGGLPTGKSVAASLFEQIFDLVMVIVLAGFGAVLQAPFLAPYMAAVLGVGLVAVLIALNRPHLVPERFHIANLTRLLKGSVGLRLATISLVIYLLTAVRAWIVAIPAGLALAPPDFFASFSLVQLSRFVAVTPMGLGITEWSWASVLSLIDLPLALAAAFVLLNRTLNIVSTLGAFVVAVALAMIFRRA